MPCGSICATAASTIRTSRPRPPCRRDEPPAGHRGPTRAHQVYQRGEDNDREAYDIAWVQDKAWPVDTINGFVEVYLDARTMKGAWESLVVRAEYEAYARNALVQLRRVREGDQLEEDHMRNRRTIVPWLIGQMLEFSALTRDLRD